MWDVTITPYWDLESPLATLMGLCTLPHLRLGNGSYTIYNDPPQCHNIVRFWLLQTKLPKMSPILVLLLQKHA
jgi:hypothetical protein